ncbi:MAG: glycosyltransferase family 2 protein [Pseudomonadota bacterium]
MDSTLLTVPMVRQQTGVRHEIRPRADARLTQHLAAKGHFALSDLPADVDPGLGPGAVARRLIQGGHVPEKDVLASYADLYGSQLIDLSTQPADATQSGFLDPQTAIALSAVPYRWVAGRLVVVTSRPDLVAEIERAIPGQTVLIALANSAQITSAIGHVYGQGLARAAECRAPKEASARVWTGYALGRRLAIPLAGLTVAAILSPVATYLALVAVAILVFAVNIGLKLASATAAHRARVHTIPPEPRAVPLFPEPVVTLLVPLFNEHRVAGEILQRIDRLDYPRTKLDVIFILEEGDRTTKAALGACALPHWARAIAVPHGQPQTKPRALNYALPFARGTVVGIYDAEDAPEPDQLRKIAARFAVAPPNVACLQGQLDYYNAAHNWISRCFTIEYATWFRLVLPGVERLGLVVPLGGTTLFIKRDALIRIGAWDAHNVTEDAELGIRLQRAGYRTELIATTTFEEANSALWPWIRQRTRWLKGYAITWATVMRRPGQLLRDLGSRRFWGLQAQFAGTILGFVTAPLLWSLALVPFGAHPLWPELPTMLFAALSAVFTFALIATLWINWLACGASHLRRHRNFVIVMVLYYPLASIAGLLALLDLAARPFYWAKTAHGRYGPALAAMMSPASDLNRTSNARLR